MLDNIGRRYLVEHWENEDGSQEYDLYSDGYIVQKGQLTIQVGSNNPVVFQKAFDNKNYHITLQAVRPDFTGAWLPESGYGYPIDMQATGFRIAHGNFDLDSPIQWIAQGYAA